MKFKSRSALLLVAVLLFAFSEAIFHACEQCFSRHTSTRVKRWLDKRLRVHDPFPGLPCREIPGDVKEILLLRHQVCQAQEDPREIIHA